MAKKITLKRAKYIYNKELEARKNPKLGTRRERHIKKKHKLQDFIIALKQRWRIGGRDDLVEVMELEEPDG